MKYLKPLFRLGTNQRGDTLVEVMLAISVLGIVVVGTMTIMNKSTMQMLDTIERTAVRSTINSQTELLNYVRDNSKGASATVWTTIQAKTVTSASSVSGTCAYNANSFYLNRSSSTDDAVTLTALTTGSAKNANGKAVIGNGVWVDAVRSSAAVSPAYIDFYIRACWARLANVADAKTATVVRLYVP